VEDAARAYLHDRLNGQHTMLMTGTDAMAAELARRVRGDLIAWGVVSDGPVVALRDGGPVERVGYGPCGSGGSGPCSGRRPRTLEIDSHSSCLGRASLSRPCHGLTGMSPNARLWLAHDAVVASSSDDPMACTTTRPTMPRERAQTARACTELPRCSPQMTVDLCTRLWPAVTSNSAWKCGV
jgi:hypothetical protein